jgi:Flp pilus assembly protein TadG
MPIRIAAAFALCLSTAAAAQQGAAPPARPTMQQLLGAGYDLKAVELTTGPCGNQPANRTQQCRREFHYLQSPRKESVFRCEIGNWNGRVVQECTRV